jgi:hypothetical protein
MLPQKDLPRHASLPTTREPHIDYSKNHILTFDEFVASLEVKAARKQVLMEGKQAR